MGRAPWLSWIPPLLRPLGGGGGGGGGGGYDRIALREGEYCDLLGSVASLAGAGFVY